MDKLIPLNKGIHRQPSVGADGELSELVNLVPVNGELKNVRGLDKWCALPAKALHAEEVVYIHKVGEFGNIICLADNSKNLLCLPYRPDVQELDGFRFANVTDFKSITSVGNTLIVSDGENIRYFIWKDNTYTELKISGAGFSITIQSDNEKNVAAINDVIPYDTNVFPSLDQQTYKELTPSQMNELYLKADAYINERISQMDYPERWHKYITFGIAALRIYDGSYIAYTDIFSLNPKSDMHGMASCINLRTISSKTDEYQEVVATISKYEIVINEASVVDGNVVTGIDFFLTQPYSLLRKNKKAQVRFGTILFPSNLGREEMQEEISSMIFRKVYSVEKLDLDKGSYTFEIPKPLGTEEALNLVDISSFAYCPEKMLIYNGRLHLAKIDTNIIPMHKAQCNQKVLQGKDGGYEYTDSKTGYIVTSNGYYGEYHSQGVADIIYEVTINDPEYGSITNIHFEKDALYPLPPILTYPSRYAETMNIYMKVDSDYYKGTYPLQHLDTGNISFFINTDGQGIDYMGIMDKKYVEDSSEEEFSSALSNAENHSRRVGSASNTVKYSDYGNPFHFPAINSIQVGNEDIVGISTSAKALSQGQFGQFPLYVFCTDGIWALEVGSDGSYTSVTPVSRDVCNNPDSITQIDGAVVFTTDQGLMMIQGSEAVNLSSAMEGFNVNEENYFPDGFFDSYDKGDFDDLVITETRDFREILRTCKIAYDYVNKMLRIFPIGKNLKGKYYVFSLESREFATVYLSGWNGANINIVADYPSSIIQINDKLYRPSETDDNENTKKGLLLTRPITLDEPFALKKLQDMRLHYSKFDGTSKCHVVVYVSNDGTKWAPMRSLRKRSYKYYRFAIITDMKDMDALSGMVLRYEVERNNKLR